MKLRVSLLLLVAAAACSKKAPDAGGPSRPATPVASVAPPAGKQWTDVVSTSPDGFFVMGNPNAPVKLVEYASMTCPHCKHFEDEGADALQKNYVSTGKVSWEFRSFLIHGGPDVAATLLVSCRGPEPFFALTQQIYATQDDWLNKMIAMPQATQTRLQSLPPGEQFKAWADAGGLYSFFAARGLPRAQAEACLTDQKALDRLTTQQTRIQEAGVNQTPTFVINGQQQQASTWEQLEPLLKQAVGA